MEDKVVSVGVFIDGGYYAKIDEGLKNESSLALNLTAILNYIRTTVSEKLGVEFTNCQITENHYFRGRYRVNDASNKHLLYVERKFEDSMIDNDVVFHYKHLCEVKKGNEVIVIEKGIDTWFALETYELTLLRKFDVVVLITGDADHEMLVRKLKTLKSRVLLLTWNVNSQSSTSRYLKEEATWHIDLGEESIKNRSLINNLTTVINY
ncbi:MAG: NYN domain-containing protein [Bacteroidales bacterium]|nr:NYN domain-containing protein [Bacteroidales bacterium]